MISSDADNPVVSTNTLPVGTQFHPEMLETENCLRDGNAVPIGQQHDEKYNTGTENELGMGVGSSLQPMPGFNRSDVRENTELDVTNALAADPSPEPVQEAIVQDSTDHLQADSTSSLSHASSSVASNTDTEDDGQGVIAQYEQGQPDHGLADQEIDWGLPGAELLQPEAAPDVQLNISLRQEGTMWVPGRPEAAAPVALIDLPSVSLSVASTTEPRSSSSLGTLLTHRETVLDEHRRQTGRVQSALEIMGILHDAGQLTHPVEVPHSVRAMPTLLDFTFDLDRDFSHIRNAQKRAAAERDARKALKKKMAVHDIQMVQAENAERAGVLQVVENHINLAVRGQLRHMAFAPRVSIPETNVPTPPADALPDSGPTYELKETNFASRLSDSHMRGRVEEYDAVLAILNVRTDPLPAKPTRAEPDLPEQTPECRSSDKRVRTKAMVLWRKKCERARNKVITTETSALEQDTAKLQTLLEERRATLMACLTRPPATKKKAPGVPREDDPEAGKRFEHDTIVRYFTAMSGMTGLRLIKAPAGDSSLDDVTAELARVTVDPVFNVDEIEQALYNDADLHRADYLLTQADASPEDDRVDQLRVDLGRLTPILSLAKDPMPALRGRVKEALERSDELHTHVIRGDVSKMRSKTLLRDKQFGPVVLNCLDREGQSPLYKAFLHNQDKAFAALLNAGCLLEDAFPDGHPLLAAVANPLMLNALLATKLEVNTVSGNTTALVSAIQGGHWDSALELLNNGADPLLPPDNNSWYAALVSPDSIFAQLIQHEIQTVISRRLAEAVSRVDISGVKRLLSAQVIPYGSERHLTAPLFAAVRTGSLECVSVLLGHGADPRATLGDRTALQLCKGNKHMEFVLSRTVEATNRGVSVERGVKAKLPARPALNYRPADSTEVETFPIRDAVCSNLHQGFGLSNARYRNNPGGGDCAIFALHNLDPTLFSNDTVRTRAAARSLLAKPQPVLDLAETGFTTPQLREMFEGSNFVNLPALWAIQLYLSGRVKRDTVGQFLLYQYASVSDNSGAHRTIERFHIELTNDKFMLRCTYPEPKVTSEWTAFAEGVGYCHGHYFNVYPTKPVSQPDMWYSVGAVPEPESTSVSVSQPATSKASVPHRNAAGQQDRQPSKRVSALLSSGITLLKQKRSPPSKPEVSAALLHCHSLATAKTGSIPGDIPSLLRHAYSRHFGKIMPSERASTEPADDDSFDDSTREELLALLDGIPTLKPKAQALLNRARSILTDGPPLSMNVELADGQDLPDALHTLLHGTLWAVMMAAGADPDLDETLPSKLSELYTTQAKCLWFMCKKLYFCQHVASRDSDIYVNSELRFVQNGDAYAHILYHGRLFLANSEKERPFTRAAMALSSRVEGTDPFIAVTPRGLWEWKKDNLPTRVRFRTSPQAAEYERCLQPWSKDRLVKEVIFGDFTVIVVTEAGLFASGSGAPAFVGNVRHGESRLNPIFLPDGFIPERVQFRHNVAVLTMSDRQMISGRNDSGQLGLGHSNSMTGFVDLPFHVDSILTGDHADFSNFFESNNRILFVGHVWPQLVASGLLPGFEEEDTCVEPTPLRYQEPVKAFFSDDSRLVWVTEGETHYVRKMDGIPLSEFTLPFEITHIVPDSIDRLSILRVILTRRMNEDDCDCGISPDGHQDRFRDTAGIWHELAAVTNSVPILFDCPEPTEDHKPVFTVDVQPGEYPSQVARITKAEREKMNESQHGPERKWERDNDSDSDDEDILGALDMDTRMQLMLQSMMS
ncbi:Ankyrin repeats (3 copies) [Carpediemonas membranifera]|uniref:Ankyrin repeats (3 copies) n=1 Tax=Carpediemonas membranifera TaxID=201153 RepID=A0A8J6E589_9EUKA|nr:Ankyrin repeats (3 copies) [Carpediemonas membranifera]|eukprot:KAG9395437.1 Ankyrin repeats (3 copies) [Carpediemonas membranifera]